METPQTQRLMDRKDALAGAVIVLLEDDDLVRRATERLLRRFGAEVVAGTSSSEVLGLMAARRLTPNWVVADYWLSHQESGLSAAAAVREAVAGPLRGLIVTGDFSREVAEEVARAGFSLLRKPVDVESFVEALRDSD